jgi:single-strand DNA-binding protein
MTGTMEEDRFPILPRALYDADEWFGLEANPEGTINVPFVDPYVPYPDWTGFEDDHDTQTISRKAPTIMAGETTITVIGNLTNDPELRFTPVSREFGKTEGTPVANFTIASTPRTFDAQSKEWKDGETLFLRSTVWRETAENVAASLIKGSRVVASGRLKPRTYETKTGEKRTVIEFEIDEIGLSLRYSAAEAKGSQPKRPSRDEAQIQDEVAVQGTAPLMGWGDRVKALPETAAVGDSEYADDDPWFGKNATGAGYAQPTTAAEPRI